VGVKVEEMLNFRYLVSKTEMGEKGPALMSRQFMPSNTPVPSSFNTTHSNNNWIQLKSTVLPSVMVRPPNFPALSPSLSPKLEKANTGRQHANLFHPSQRNKKKIKSHTYHSNF
jgi:hypothetical protein